MSSAITLIPKIEVYPVNIQHTRQIDITIRENLLTVAVDKQVLVDKQEIDTAIKSGGVALESAYSERNKKDDIYDAVFTDLNVVALADSAAGSDTVLFRNSYTGFEKVVHVISEAIHATIDWVIETF